MPPGPLALFLSGRCSKTTASGDEPSARIETHSAFGLMVAQDLAQSRTGLLGFRRLEAGEERREPRQAKQVAVGSRTVRSVVDGLCDVSERYIGETR